MRLLNCTRLARDRRGRGRSSCATSSRTVPDPYVTWTPLLPDNVKNPLARPIRVEEREFSLPADLVVLAVGIIPDDGLYHACLQAQAAPEIHNIGDAFAAGRVFEAVKAGYALGCAV